MLNASVMDCAGHWMPVLFHGRAVGLVWPKGFVLELELSCHKSSVSELFFHTETAAAEVF